jgi:hypothetical protein
MAQDHRGREVHAGWRSDTDAMRAANAVVQWNPYAEGRSAGADIAEDAAYDRGDVTHPMRGSVSQNKQGRWDALLYRMDDYDPYSSSWAESSLAIENDRVNDRLSRFAPDGFRTEARAKMAVAAMINRRNEGRDYQTGRGPSWPKGSQPGHPY